MTIIGVVGAGLVGLSLGFAAGCAVALGRPSFARGFLEGYAGPWTWGRRR